jgi:molecular chaperone DnaK
LLKHKVGDDWFIWRVSVIGWKARERRSNMAIVGIDLGTSNSAAAVLRGGRPVIIPSAEGISLGGKAFPSYVAITANGEMLVGEPARRQVVVNPDGTATVFKRRMGQREKIHLRDR